ncbi:MAG: hypothetical protein KTR30_12225 [Saprospiraceae bacterium]|nr:hypothetical protein [Saprospiraceae bacterium]
MEKTKLVALLKTFDAKQWSEFDEYIRSPFFNKNQELIEFFQLLRSYAPRFHPKKVDRRKLFQELYGVVVYDEKKMNHLSSLLLKQLEDYIGYKWMKRQTGLSRYHVMEACFEKNLPKHYRFLASRFAKNWGGKEQKGAAFHHQQLLAADLANRSFLKERSRKYDPHLQIASDQLDAYYLIKKLKYSCEMLDRGQAMAANYELPLMPEIFQFLQDQDYTDIPLIAIYSQIYAMLTQEDKDAHFQKLKRLIHQHIDQLDTSEIQLIYLFAINYSIRKLRAGDTRYLAECLDLYLESIEKKLVYVDGHLSPWTFKNVVKLGLKLDRIDWTEQFILKHSPELSEGFRDNAYHYNLADLHFWKQSFNEAQKHLQEVSFTDIHYALDSKVLFLKIFYEKRDWEVLLSQAAAFRMFLKRNKVVTKQVRQPYENFIRILLKLIKQKNSVAVKAKAQLQDMPYVFDREWLLKKLKEQLTHAQY